MSVIVPLAFGLVLGRWFYAAHLNFFWGNQQFLDVSPRRTFHAHEIGH